MSANINEQIDKYFSEEKNLHRLREKLFSLSEYRLQSDINDEIECLREEKELIAEDLKQKYKKTMEEMTERYRRKLQQMEEQYKESIKQKENELASFRDSVDNELKRATQDRAELIRWQACYGDFAKAFSNFSKLSLKHKEAIAGIFGGCDTPMDFFCGSVQKGHLEQLWDYICDELDAPNMDEQEAMRLSELFDFSFNAVNCSQREPLFRRLAAHEGEAFDGDTMGRSSDSPQLGRVKRLVFPGFAYEVTGSVVRRSLVKLE